jgi:HTH-type transcriptional regulator/antitoxin HipB
MKHTPETIGKLVKNARKTMGVTQKDLAMTSGTGLRFIIDMEKGKPTCQLGKVLTVLHTLGIKTEFIAPVQRPDELEQEATEKTEAEPRPGNYSVSSVYSCEKTAGFRPRYLYLLNRSRVWRNAASGDNPRSGTDFEGVFVHVFMFNRAGFGYF